MRKSPHLKREKKRFKTLQALKECDLALLVVNPRESAALNRLLDCRPYVETGYGIMNHYVNDVFNGSWRQDEIADEARKKLDELRPLLP